MNPKAVLLAASLPDPAELREGRLADLEIIATIWVEQEDRSALVRALAALARANGAVLVVERLRDAVSSLMELVALLEWLRRAGCDLVSLQPAFDTRERSGQVAVGLLEEVVSWERADHPRRKPKGRPGLAAVDPALHGRIVELHRQGLGLKAIAELLNAEGVPTVRGGKRWRASSVQAALGYKRPEPHLKGAPPPPPPPGGPPPPHHPPRGPR